MGTFWNPTRRRLGQLRRPHGRGERQRLRPPTRPRRQAVKYTDSQTIAVQRGLPIGPPAGTPLDRYATAMTTTFKAMKKLPFIKMRWVRLS